MTDHPSLQEFFDSPGALAADLNISASAAEPLGQSELLALEPGAAERFNEITLNYPRRHASTELLEAVSRKYDAVTPDGLLPTSGVDEALGMLFLSLVEPGDRVVVLFPCYPPHLELPRWRGAETVPWPARAEADWVPDLDELRRLTAEPTRLILTTFPQNPTGFMPDAAFNAELLEIVEASGAILVADEIYAGLPSGAADGLSGLADRHDRVISLHGFSKTLGLPGLRLGWMAARDPALLEPIRAVRTLFNAYVPTPVDFLANLALRHEAAILERNSRILEAGKRAASAFMARHGNLFEWTEPKAGVLSFPRWNGPGGTSELSQRLLAEAKLVCAPSLCFDAGDQHFRIGLARRNLPDALARLDGFLERL
jgi:aspartate/methionine/tyrosine aminotransferase